MNHTPTTAPAWQQDIFKVLKEGDVRQIAYVPDAGHAHVIAAHADPDMSDVVLTTEEEGIALAAGAWLGGQRAVLLMQSSGVGNCVNMLSLPHDCRFPFLTLVTMRGEWARVQSVAGADGPGHAERCSTRWACRCCRVDTPDEVEEIVGAGCDARLRSRQPVAVLLAQRLIGRKNW